MCTIHYFHARYAANHIEAIRDEWNSNPDGCVIIEMNNGKVDGMFKTMNKHSALQYLKNSTADTFIVHLRAATGSNITINTIHGFVSECGEWLYVHNGVIPEAADYVTDPYVDSLAIGNCIAYRTDEDIQDLPFHYAMVLAVHVTDGVVMCHRSVSGSLHHNPFTGCISTKRMAGCDTPCIKDGWWVVSDSRDELRTSHWQNVTRYLASKNIEPKIRHKDKPSPPNDKRE